MARQRAVIVGGGVLGTMHAVEACRLGWEVTHLESDAGPRRASVRNFGLVWVSGRAPHGELDLAVRARSRWEELAAEVADHRGDGGPGDGTLGFRPDGSITVATGEAELDLMRELADRPDAALRDLEVLDPDGVRAANPALRSEVAGGLLCRRDAVVEPGSVLGALRGLAGRSGRYRWLPGHTVVSATTGGDGDGDGDGAVVTDHLGGVHRGDVAVLCIGDRHAGLGGAVGAALAGAPLRRCRLQMLQTAPAAERLTTAVADADTMRYYPAFDLPARRALPQAREETVRWGMQLLLVQRAGGGLTIGDTHVYDEPFDFAVDESLTDHLVARAEAVLGWDLPPVIRRWTGVYSVSTDDRVCYRAEVEPAVWVVTGPAGRGMTLSPAIAADTWAEATR